MGRRPVLLRLGNVSAPDPALTQVAGLPIADPDLAAAVSDGLDRVEELLRREVHSDYRFVTDTSLHLIEAGGKRFRPLLTLLAAQLAGGTSEDVVVAATSVELVHLATLYHDDVMDEAVMRRGADSANARWDNSIAILTGDYLFAHASRLVSQLGPEAVRIIAETFAELVTGQMRETRGARDGEDPIDHYLAVVAEKTGSLIATSGRFGAMFAGAPDEHVTAMRRFGEIIGTAFQVSDDIIDIASPSGDSGKTPGTDLREGVATLPVLYALAGDGPEVPRLRELGVGTRELGDPEVGEALELLRGSRGLDEARAALDARADAARAELATLPDGPARRALEALLDYTIARTG
ncbi:polyprenyl synthetase family protein [Actinomycetospora succinea]|uniref:polyprenyl synthetase family protein n=1 Tax=Actinomycetospora succinea TaxID=663603 RepID=UPI00105F7B17